MAEQTYSELLKRAEWQRRRKEVLEAASHTCEECGESGVPFEVHHRYYLRGKKPWEYPGEALRCVCGPCHRELGHLDDELRFTIGQLTTHQIEMVRVFARRLFFAGDDPREIDEVYRQFYAERVRTLSGGAS